MSHKIAFMNCHFGKMPWYFQYFLHSCKYNPSIDFFIITDDHTYAGRLPNNVKMIMSSLEEINALATQKLGFQTAIRNPYKLCDFKPAYGLLFEDILQYYDFWGINDIDIIFGDIRNFMTDEVLSDFDLISVRHDYITGYFSLFRNNDAMRWLFSHSKDYRKVFNSDRHYCFDETNFKHEAFARGTGEIMEAEIESMTHVALRLQAQGYLKAYFNWHVIEACPGRMKWSRGKLIYKNEYEVLLYHLITLKETFAPSMRAKPLPEEFMISPTRIY